jgi:Uma2 family endonuclease
MAATVCWSLWRNVAMSSETKQSGKLGYREYVCYPNDGRRHEIIDGDHYVNPAPNTYHQTLSRRLQFQLYTQIELSGLGEVYDAPTDLQLSDHDIVQPDLIVVLKQHRIIITPTKIKGTPDLVVEILSDSTTKNDRGLKRELYQKSAVPEYWIVDPEEHRVEQYELRGERYELLGRHTDLVSLRILENIRVNLTEVW